MTESAKLRLPYIAASQAQKHVTHNEALTLLDTLVQASVIDKDLTTPPGSPAEGDCYIVAAGGTGAWEGWDNRIARHIDGEWRSYLPGAGSGEGWLVYVQDEETLYVFDGAAWSQLFISASISLTTATETLTGTEAGKAVTPDALAALWEKGADVASASTISLGEGGYFHITGTTAITDIDFAVAKDGRAALLVFDGALTLTHHATTLILPGGANIVTAAGDVCLVVQDAGDNIRVAGYWRAGGKPVAATGTLADNSVMRADGTGGNVQGSSGVTIDDDGVLTINRNAAPLPAPLSGTSLHLGGADGTSPRIIFDGFASNPNFSFRKARGSAASPSALQAGDVLGTFVGFGYGATGYSSGGRVQVILTASENWTDSAQGTYVTIVTTPNGTLMGGERLRVDHDGALVHRGNTTKIVDANSHLGLRSYTVGTLPSAAAAGFLIYVSNGASNKRLAVSDGTNWRFPDGAIVS